MTKRSEYSAFGRKVADFMYHNNLYQYEVAKAIGVTPAAISLALRGCASSRMVSKLEAFMADYDEQRAAQ